MHRVFGVLISANESSQVFCDAQNIFYSKRVHQRSIRADRTAHYRYETKCERCVPDSVRGTSYERSRCKKVKFSSAKCIAEESLECGAARPKHDILKKSKYNMKSFAQHSLRTFSCYCRSACETFFNFDAHEVRHLKRHNWNIAMVLS